MPFLSSLDLPICLFQALRGLISTFVINSSMAISKFWVLALRFVVGLCVLSVVLKTKIFAVAKDYAAVYDDGDLAVIDRADDVNGSGGSGGSEIGRVEGSDICGSDLSSFLPLPYSNISKMTCTPIWNTFILRYSENEDKVMTIILSAIYTTGWVGMGFSKDGMMAGSSAMVGWINKEGKARIKQYYLQGVVPTQVIPDKGELPLTNMPSDVVLHGATIYLAFQMKFATPLTRQPLILAFGSAYPHHSRLTRHDDKTTIMFDFSARSGSRAPVNNNFGQMKKTHGILGVIGWGLILPIGAIVPRYFKHKDPLWYYLHTVIQFVGFIIGLATVVVGRQLYNTVHVPTHRGIGIFVLVLSILQILAFFLRPNKDAKIRKYWNWYHHWFGRFALFFAAVNIVLGIQIGGAGSEWKIGYGFLLSIVLVAVIVLETLLWMKRSEKSPPDSAFQMNPI